MRTQFAVVIAVAVSIWLGCSQALLAQSSSDMARKSVGDTTKDLAFPNLAQWDVSDPRLKETYERYLAIDPEDFESWPRWALEIVEDWKRRGDSATPMLLRILEENINKLPGVNLLERVDSPVRKLDRDPFVSWARKAIDEKLEQLDDGFCIALAELLVHHGDANDLVRLVRIKVDKPKIRSSIDELLRVLTRRLKVN